MGKFILFLFIAIALPAICQDRTLLHADNGLKIYFKAFDHHYGFIIEEEINHYNAVLVKYEIKENSFVIEETDTIIVLDSLIYHSEYIGDNTDFISLRFRTHDHENSEMRIPKLTYIINNTLVIHSGLSVKNDTFHRAELELQNEPFQLVIDAGFRKIGPFTIEPNKTGKTRNLNLKIVVLKSCPSYEYNLSELMPKVILFEGKSYPLKATFLD